MAIYSCNLRSIGRTTHAPGTAGAHIRYIARADADPLLLAAHMPYDDQQARNWIDARERAMRKNGRVIDKLRIALPRELDEHLRAALVETFMADLTGGHVPWFAAIHQRGKDAHNPHVHIAVHDRDLDTGRRVLRLSDNAKDRIKAGLPGPKAVEWVRERWEVVCNEALAEAGHEARVDRRTLAAQGSDRKPGIHEGPRAQLIEAHIHRPNSRERTNGCGRLIDYPSIDHGRTRREFNAQIVDLNLERAGGSSNPATSAWAQHEKEELAKDRALEQRLAEEQHKRTMALRAASQEHLERIKRLRTERDDELRKELASVHEKFLPQRDALRQRQHKERKALKDKQSRFRGRLLRILDITGITRRRQEAARKVLAMRHKGQRKELTGQYQAARTGTSAAIKSRTAATIKTAQRSRTADLAQMKNRHQEMERFADHQRQKREIEREHNRGLVETKIAGWNKSRKDGSPLGVESSFARAMKRAAEHEARFQAERGKDDDMDREQ